MAKGLEFPQVFITGMEEGIFPHYRSMTDSEIEEERRLCYVAMTRAKEKLHLSWAARRNQYGTYQYQRPSRFLGEIPEDLREGDAVDGGRRRDFASGRAGEAAFGRSGETSWEARRESHGGFLSSTPEDLRDGTLRDPRQDLRRKPSEGSEVFKSGDKIMHAMWGPGVVVSTKGDGSSLTYTVAFPDKGLRILQADIAPIERME